MPEIIITEVDDGKSLRVRTGDSFVVRLRESPTTGYRWAIDTTNAAVLSPRRSEFVQDAEAAIGGGGLRNFEFQTLRQGTADLGLKLWREWEGEESALKRFRVIIRVV
jgi:inhibitor of cysteine peptidase